MNNTIKAWVILATFMFCHYMMRAFFEDNWNDLILTLDQQAYILFQYLKAETKC